jgi:hypothetical protein
VSLPLCGDIGDAFGGFLFIFDADSAFRAHIPFGDLPTKFQPKNQKTGRKSQETKQFQELNAPRRPGQMQGDPRCGGAGKNAEKRRI